MDKSQQMTKEEYAETVKYKLCWCGSKQRKYPAYDGYGIFLTYVCDKCVDERMGEFRPDIMSQYDHDEPLDDE